MSPVAGAHVPAFHCCEAAQAIRSFDPMIDLNPLHHAAHQITGDMAVRFNRATAADLMRWAAALRALADQMIKAAVAASASEPRP
jgi:hypothetical protein